MTNKQTIVSQIRSLTLEEIPVGVPESDPTIANAGLTELDDGTTAQLANGAAKLNLSEEPSVVTENASTAPEASNAAANGGWDPNKSTDLSESFEMVSSRDAEETQNSTPTGPEMKQSWSDIPGDSSLLAASTASLEGGANDGFHEVRHHHGGRGGRGSQSGPQQGYRGGDRGRGGSGRGGRGFRGGARGDRGGPRGGRGEGGYRGRGRGD
jgi:hypothetical protein